MPRLIKSNTQYFLSKLTQHKTLVFLALTFLSCVIVLFVLDEKIDTDLSSIFSKISSIPYLYLLSSLCLILLQNLFQGTRLWLLLSNTKASWWKTLSTFFLGQAVNQLLPGRMGDLFKATMISNTSTAQKSLSFGSSLGSVFISDKLIEISGLLFLALPLVPFLFLEISVDSMIPLMIIIGSSLAIFLLITYFFRNYLFSAYEKHLKQFITGALQGIASLKNTKVLTFGLIIAILAWLSEALALQALALGTNHHLSFKGAIGAILILNIGIAIPITFANIGTFEAALAFGLSRFNVSTVDAIAIASIHHILQVSAVFLWNLPVIASGAFKISKKLKLNSNQKNKEVAFNYYQNRSIAYDDDIHKGATKEIRKGEQAAILELADFHNAKGKKCIDVGCGGGFYAKAAKNSGLHVTAVDFSPKMIELVKPFVDECWVSDIETLSTDTKYDIVICSGVLDFVISPIKAFDNLANLLAPNGKLIIQVPRKSIGGFGYRVEKIFFKIRVNLFSVRWFQKQSIRNNLKLVHYRKPFFHNLVLLFERK